MNRVEELIEDLLPFRKQLAEHPVLDRIDDLGALRIFMKSHVFAVWDFMTLLKSMQRQLTSTDVLWRPSPNRLACRLVNEIVCAEESDDDGRGGYSSHFELYLRAMRSVGAETQPIEAFVDAIASNRSWVKVLEKLPIPEETRQFVYQNVATAQHGQAWEVAASFTFGRELMLPPIFEKIAAGGDLVRDPRLADLKFYLDRHIQLDSEQHGPQMLQVMQSLCESEPRRWRLARESATLSLRGRLAMFDGILREIESPTEVVLDDHAATSRFAERTEELIQFAWLDGLEEEEIARQTNKSRFEVDRLVRANADLRWQIGGSDYLEA